MTQTGIESTVRTVGEGKEGARHDGELALAGVIAAEPSRGQELLAEYPPSLWRHSRIAKIAERITDFAEDGKPVDVALQRASRDQGGKWSIDVESHFGSWEQPLYYERPQRGDGWGYGCIACTPTQAHGLSLAGVHTLFEQHSELKDGKRVFPSKRKLRDAMIAAGMAAGNDGADKRIQALLDDLTTPYVERVCAERPILVTSGPNDNSPVCFTWRHDGSEEAGLHA